MRYLLTPLMFLALLVAVIYLLQPQLVKEYLFSSPERVAPEEILDETAATSDRAVRTEVDELSVPWSIIFLPDQSMLVSERGGTLAHVTKDKVERLEVPEVDTQGEGGLLGIVLHPDFETNRWLYVYMTHTDGDKTKNRVVRFVYTDNSLTEPKKIIENIPGASYHDGGRIAFGPDNYLYITTGDAGVEDSAQDKNSVSGKILRLTDEGGVPKDNPFGNAVYSYGHRNPQGLAWDAGGRLWSSEHGRSGVQSGFDEINLIEKGANYGWPLIEGDETQDGLTPPILHSGSDKTWAPASLVYHEGKLFWGGLRGESLYEVTIADETLENLTEHFHGQYGRIRPVTIGFDNRLYFGTSNLDSRGAEEDIDDLILSVDPKSL